MTTRAKHEHLLMRYLDGRLTEAETRELSAWLREDAVARAWLRDVAGQVVALGDLAREQHWQSPKPEVAGVESISGRFSRTAWLALAASVVVLGCAVAFWFDGRHGTPSVVVEIEDVTGALNWTGPTGELRTGLTRGQQLSAGMFETASEGAMAQLRFTDGTRVTLGNRTEVALAEDRQKQLRLKAGLLAFEVLPQPPGRPLLVRTPTAMLEVLGTVFTVTAGADQTTLNVEEGRVRLERLTDGEVLDVTSQQTAVATLGQTERFQASTGSAPPVRWRRTFTEPPEASWKGDWQPASGAEPAFVRAVPCVAGQREDGMPVYQLGITARGNGAHLVTLGPDSVLRLRWRTAQPASLRVMLGVQKADGRFGGNFEVRIPKETTQPGKDGWRTVVISLGEFRPLIQKHPAPPERGQVSLIFITSSTDDTELQVAELAIEPTGSTKN